MKDPHEKWYREHYQEETPREIWLASRLGWDAAVKHMEGKMNFDIDLPQDQINLSVGYFRGLALRDPGAPLEERDLKIIREFSDALYVAWYKNHQKATKDNEPSPDPFEEAWDHYAMERINPTIKGDFKAGWDAAVKHMEEP